MPDDRDFARGRRLLRELLPWARAELAKGNQSAEMSSALGRATVTYVTEDNLDALMIYPAPKGGWHADLVFKKVPPGIANTIGTPVERPCRTRAEAEDRVKRLLVMALFLAEKNKNERPEPAAPVFTLNGWTLRLLPELYKTALAIFPEKSGGYGSQLQAYARVEAALDELCPEGFDGDAFNTWPRDKQAQLLTVLHIAALSGLYVYPMRKDGPPGEEGEQALRGEGKRDG